MLFRSEPGDLNGVGLDYKELPRDVKPGDTLLLNDGLIVLTVDGVYGEQVHTTVKIGGELIRVQLHPAHAPRSGDAVTLRLPAEHCLVVPG